MTTDYRALLLELAQVLAEEYGVEREFSSGGPLLGNGAIELLARARIALAEAYEVEANNPPEGHPDPEPFQAILRERAAALQPEPVGLRPSDDDIYGLFDWLKDEWHSNNEGEFPLPEFARAVLQRWGAPPPSAT